jgi:phosphopantothenoylcysteine decarboxylase/phosphopantothenate--cysteine ligase
VKGSRIVLGVSGGIAAYKSCELLRLLTEAGHSVRVIPTVSALEFVAVPTWAALSGEPVSTQVWETVHEVPHVRIGQSAELVVVAPATADLLARAAHGIADDLLTNTLLTVRCPVVYAPAMHTEMWEHPATIENVATLRRRGAIVLDPAVGRLTGADTGKGRLPEPEEIFAVLSRILRRGTVASVPDFAGRRVVVTAGGTREYLDPVRFLGNASSGKQGYAFARTAAARGAKVTLIAANVALADPAGVDVVRVTSTDELRLAVHQAAVGADVVVMAAAPSDYRPADYSEHKLKRADNAAPVLKLVPNPDIAAELGRSKPEGQILLVFAAETVAGPAAITNAQAKLAAKQADLVVLNVVGRDKVFGADHNAATVIDTAGTATDLGPAEKADLADMVWDLVSARWETHSATK